MKGSSKWLISEKDIPNQLFWRNALPKKFLGPFFRNTLVFLLKIVSIATNDILILRHGKKKAIAFLLKPGF